jgi:oligopeptide/dipeptide ABC transporter ATP-binding protein
MGLSVRGELFARSGGPIRWRNVLIPGWLSAARGRMSGGLLKPGASRWAGNRPGDSEPSQEHAGPPGRRHVPRQDRRDRLHRRSVPGHAPPVQQGPGIGEIPTPDPDVEREREQIILRGEIPSPLSPPPGCRFHTRCQAQVGDVCRDVEPALREVRPAIWPRVTSTRRRRPARSRRPARARPASSPNETLTRRRRMPCPSPCPRRSNSSASRPR